MPLRRARAEDAAAVADLVNRAYTKYVPRIGRPPAPMLDDYPDVIRQHEVWVGEKDDAVVAALVLILEKDTLLLDNVAVDPSYQSRGLGRRLMSFAESEALRQGYSSVRLITNEKMTENIAFYSRLGYRETGREILRERYIVHMRKDLAART
ncbi:MAG: GNAT family N-acetyltransferase [Alphaproteobacteria bacterium]|nr:GNAT family N-acetyltransferase [Alphaproteobacteria bacterium]